MEVKDQVIYEGKEIDLTPREFEVLYLLAQRPNWVIPKKNIYCSVWESNYYDDQIPYKTVEHVVWKIRKKMGHDIIGMEYQEALDVVRKNDILNTYDKIIKSGYSKKKLII